MALENLFSWSKSRDEQFRSCQRKYFYDKYASWGGWEQNAPPQTRLAYVLKYLKNRWAWKGETIHHVIEDVLKAVRGGQPLSADQALSRLTDTMRRDFRLSKAKRNYDDPKNNLGLFEHEYEKGVPDLTWQKLHDSSLTCVKNFYQSPLYREFLADDKNSWLVIEDLEDFMLEGAKVFVKLDFARKQNGFVEIFDWKTGKPDPEEVLLQMGIYSLYAMQKWGVPFENIKGYVFYLSEAFPAPLSVQMDSAIIEHTKHTIAKSVESMRELLADPVKNIPKPKEAFCFTDDPAVCGSCNFYKMCDKQQH